MTPALAEKWTEAPFPEKLDFLFDPSPYKVAYGGRGGTKSWGFARALLILGSQKRLRILCARETQKSIRDSVHQLLVTQMKELGLESFYRVEKAAIYGCNGTTILFAGLKHNVDNLKSMEAINICWVEEAQGVSKDSWDKLIPTLFRIPNCELWVSFNPDLETDDTYRRFVVEPPPGARVVKLTWRDNPWFPEGLRREMENARRRNADEYAHIWEGTCINTLANAIYANELRLVDSENRIRRVPYDPSKPVDTAWDLGYGDMVSIWMWQAFPMEYRLIDYEEGSRESISYYISELQKRPYMWGTDYLPWDGGLKALGTGKSIEELMRAAGRRVRVAPRLPILDGLNAARTVLPLCWFDQEKCADGLRHLRCYRYGEMKSMEGPTREPLHDLHCLTQDVQVLTRHGTCRIMDLPIDGEVLTPCGWSTYRGPVITRRNAQLVVVAFADGSTVRCTPDHLFLTENGWRSAESLTPGTSIQSCSIPSSNTSMVRYISDGLARFITAVTAPSFIEKSGQVLLGRFQKIATSIIGIIIPPITALRTWNVCPGLNIHGNPFIGELPSRTPPERLQQSGIALKRADCGIGSNPKNASLGASVSASRAIANIAVLNLWPSFATSIRSGFALHNAGHPGVTDTQSRLGTSKTSNRKTGPANPEDASSAVTNSWELFAVAMRRYFARSHAGPPSITTRRPLAARSTVGNAKPRYVSNAVSNLWQWFARLTSSASAQSSAGALAIVSVKHLTEREDTCCIEVPDIHCFALANGAIVHNSHCADAFRTLAVSIRQPQREREREQMRQRQHISPWS